MRTIFKLFMILLAGIAIIPATVMAGKGVFHDPSWIEPKTDYQLAESGKIDVNVMLDESLSEPSNWADDALKGYFSRISRELYDATEKQVQLGRVRVYRGSPDAKDLSDIIVSPGIDNAYSTGLATFGDSDVDARIYTKPSYISLEDIPARRQRPVLVHEMGHLVFGILDSYVGALLNLDDPSLYLQPNSDRSGYEFNNTEYWYNNDHRLPFPDNLLNIFYDTPGDNSCIMDGPWKGETEFSTPEGRSWRTDHLLPYDHRFIWPEDPDGHIMIPFTARALVVTAQNHYNGNESAWETIVRNKPAMQVPISEPVSGDTDGFVDFDDDAGDGVEFIVMPSINELSICMDRSGSMYGAPINLAKSAAGMVIDLAREESRIVKDLPGGKVHRINISGDYLSVAAFSNSGSVVFSDDGKVAEMTPANKNAAKSAINSISASGSTSIGGGLASSRNTFGVADGTRKSIILLSDGHENSSPYVSQVKQSLVDSGIMVYSVALGAGADHETLRKIAEDTGGEFFYADTEYQLPGIFATLYGNLRNDGFLAISGGISAAFSGLSVAPDEYAMLAPASGTPAGNYHIQAVYVDDMVGEATFLVTWNHGVNQFDLVDPEGIRIDGNSYSNYPGASYFSGNGYAMYRISGAKTGEWEVELLSDENVDVQWELKVFAVDSNVYFEAKSGKGFYLYPESAILRAACTEPQPVLGGHAAAEVIRPDGSRVRIDLSDDGDLAANGDERENDGIYSARFHSYTCDGVYTVTASFDSTGGETPAPSNSKGFLFAMPYPDDPPVVPQKVESFNRYRQFTFTVSGVPDIVPAAVNLHPETLNIKSKGKYITLFIELMPPYGAEDIDNKTVQLTHTGDLVCTAEQKPIAIGDHDQDGNPDLMVKFSRSQLIEYLKNIGETADNVDFGVECNLTSGEAVRGEVRTRVISPGSEN